MKKEKKKKKRKGRGIRVCPLRTINRGRTGRSCIDFTNPPCVPWSPFSSGSGVVACSEVCYFYIFTLAPSRGKSFPFLDLTPLAGLCVHRATDGKLRSLCHCFSALQIFHAYEVFPRYPNAKVVVRWLISRCRRPHPPPPPPKEEKGERILGGSRVPRRSGDTEFAITEEGGGWGTGKRSNRARDVGIK